MRPVVVYDTNILLSSIGWGGNPARCLELARQGNVEGLTCTEILRELEDKLPTKLNFAPTETADTLEDLRSFLKLVKINNTLKGVTADPDDDKIIECAVVGGATHIVTGDRRHLLPVGNYRSIQIVTARDFLLQLTSSPQTHPRI